MVYLVLFLTVGVALLYFYLCGSIRNYDFPPLDECERPVKPKTDGKRGSPSRRHTDIPARSETAERRVAA